MDDRWSQERAWEWYNGHRWLVGCNFTPSTAINQLEMWQADTFDNATIERELGWAGDLGFNTIRVYLHNLLWENDPTGVIERINRFLEIASGKGINPVFVFFDDCWNSTFKPGRQPVPRPGVHNSGWVQSPGSSKVLDPSTWGPLEDYVKGILNAFGDDDRILRARSTIHNFILTSPCPGQTLSTIPPRVEFEPFQKFYRIIMETLCIDNFMIKKP